MHTWLPQSRCPISQMRHQSARCVCSRSCARSKKFSRQHTLQRHDRMPRSSLTRSLSRYLPPFLSFCLVLSRRPGEESRCTRPQSWDRLCGARCHRAREWAPLWQPHRDHSRVACVRPAPQPTPDRHWERCGQVCDGWACRPVLRGPTRARELVLLQVSPKGPTTHRASASDSSQPVPTATIVAACAGQSVCCPVHH
jgi:hypothetical protein